MNPTKTSITALYLGWNDPQTDIWYPQRRLTWQDGKYYCVYLQGMKDLVDMGKMKALIAIGIIKLDYVYISNELPEEFREIMPVNRPFDNPQSLANLGLSTDLKKFDPFAYVACDGKCDLNRELCAQTEPDANNAYHFYFGTDTVPNIEIPHSTFTPIRVGDRLTLVGDRLYWQNLLVGCAPKYIADLAKHKPEAIAIEVERINDWQRQFDRLFCHVKVNGNMLVPFNDRRYRPLAEALVSN